MAEEGQPSLHGTLNITVIKVQHNGQQNNIDNGLAPSRIADTNNNAARVTVAQYRPSITRFEHHTYT